MSLKKKVARILRKVADNLSDNSSNKKSHYKDVNEILHDMVGDVPDISDEERQKREKEMDELWKSMNDEEYYLDESLKKHWSEGYTILAHATDKWQPLPENELLPGEISASITAMGKYIVRSSQRVYEIKCTNDQYAEVPVSSEIVQQFKGITMFSFQMQRKLKEINNYDINIYHEIYVKQEEDEGSDFIRLARARVSRTGAWSESISEIFLAKENKTVPDEMASLLAHVSWIGDSHSTDTWFKFDSNGKMTRLKLGGYGNDEGEKFEEFNGEW